MNTINFSSPHISKTLSLSKLMLMVVIAGIPGALTMMYYFGWGVLINLVVAISFGLATECFILKARGLPFKKIIKDNSAIVTAFLYALCLPALLPWWANAIGIIFAIALVKHLYGGIGNNLFNPAMAGYALLLISFPVAMTTHWVAPSGLLPNSLSLWQTLSVVFVGQLPDGTTIPELAVTIDAVTSATPLDTMKTAITQNVMAKEILNAPLFGQWGGLGWEWINFAFFLGGLFLVYTKIADWRIPLSMIVTLWTISMLFNSFDPERFVSPLFHIVTGGTMLGAFFIATDPVTASTTPKGRLLYGALIGLLIFIIRTWSSYPDGVAFAVLLMNMTVPMLDHYTKPRTYGHQTQHL